MATIPTIDPCRLRPPPASTFMVHGRTVGSRPNRTHWAVVGALSVAFPYDAARNVFLCPAGKELTLQIITNEENGVRRHVTKHRKQLVAPVPCAISAGPKTGGLNGDGPSLEMRSLLLPLHLRPRWRPKLHNKSTGNGHRSQSSRTPG